MGWPLRMFQEEGYYFVTSRCFQGRLLLRPSAEVNEVVGGVLARAVQRSAGNVRLHAFTFASNHFHLLVWARGAALAGFMQYLRANLSRLDDTALVAEARAQDKPVLGVRAVKAQHPHTRPEHLERSPRPLGHASTRQALKELREQYRAFVAAFREAAARWRRGDFSASFPLFSFPPRIVPGRVARVL